MTSSNDVQAASASLEISGMSCEHCVARVKKALEAERHAFEAKTAKLRALRLAKEAADAEQAVRLAADTPAKKTAPRKAAKTR